jgi:hypothetical protein
MSCEEEETTCEFSLRELFDRQSLRQPWPNRGAEVGIRSFDIRLYPSLSFVYNRTRSFQLRLRPSLRNNPTVA